MQELFVRMGDWAKTYFDNVPLTIVIVLSYLYLSIESKDFRKKLLYPVLLMIFLFVNPILFKYLYEKTRYWRWFWNIPNSLIIAAAVCSIVKKIKKTWIKLAAFAAAACAVIFTGHFFYHSDEYIKTQNPYKIDQEIVDICDAICEENSNPLCIMDAPIHMRGRQVAGNIKTVFGRDANYYIMEHDPSKMTLYATIRDLPWSHQYEYVLDVAKDRNVDFITLQKPRAIPDDYQRIYNYRLFYETENYNVYKHSDEEWGYERVIVIQASGAETWFEDMETSKLDSIFADGKICGQMAVPQSLSDVQEWASLLYGADSRIRSLAEEAAEREYRVFTPLESIFSIVKKSFPDDAVGSIVSSASINNNLLDCAEDIYHFESSSPDGYLSNQEVVSETIKWVSENDPKLLFIEMNDIENAGLTYGYGSEQFLEAVRRTDASIGELYEFFEEKGLMEDTLFIVTTDLNGSAPASDGLGKCMFAVKGKEVAAESDIINIQLQDIAPVILYALNIDKPVAEAGIIPKGIWNGIGKDEREIVLYMQDGVYRNHESSAAVSDLPLPITDKAIYMNSFDTAREDIIGAEYLVPGYYGNALACTNGYGQTGIDSSKMGYQSSVSFWIRPGEISGYPVILSNKDWSSGGNRGFMISHREDKIQVNLADSNGNRCDFFFPLPSNYWNGWTHFVFSFDLEKRKVTQYCDFTEICSETIPENIDVTELMNENQIMVAQDITGQYGEALNASLDDVFIFDNVLTKEDIAALRDYYTGQQ